MKGENVLATNKTGNSVKMRSSNLEVFRIISMLLIIAHHYVVNSGLMAADGPIHANLWSAKSLFLLLFCAFGKTGINCFLLITGYFMCKSHITVKKFFKLFLEVEFYKIVIYFIFIISGYSQFDLAGFIKVVMPFTSVGQNFTGCFLIFFLLIPFLNIVVSNMKEKQHIKLVLLLLFVYVVMGTVLSNKVTMNYVTWFVVLYFVASYVRMYPKDIFNNTKIWAVLAIGSVVVSALSVIVCTYLVVAYKVGNVHAFLVDSNRILAFTTGFSCFMFFKNVKIKNSKFINTVAASCFGVLLIHANGDAMRQWLWKDVLSNVEMYDSKYLVVHACASVIGIFVVCAFIDYLRICFIEKPFFKLWDKQSEKILSVYSKIENWICEKLAIETD